MLLLHRPDYLMNPHEIAESFTSLHRDGKVRHFGVSNFSPTQVTTLQNALAFDLVMNQVEINIHNLDALTDGTLDLCLSRNITPQAWAPIAGVVRPPLNDSLSSDDYQRIRKELQRQSIQYEAPDWVVMLTWLLKHPAGIVPIIGSTSPERINDAVTALDISYSREDWYRLLEARNGCPVP